MAHKRKGRKIYTYRVRNRKMFSKAHPMRSAFSILLTLALVVFSGIVGYSIAEPITKRLQAEAESPTTVPPVTETTTSALTTANTTASETADTLKATEATTTTTTAAAVIHQRFPEPTELIFCVSPETVGDIKLLDLIAENIAQQEYTAMLLPLKTAGGSLLYNSGVEAAQVSGASSEALPSLSEISGILSKRGLSAMALFDTLNDQTYPSAYTNGAYTLADSSERWLDTKVENGGKPWLSPFTDAGKGYLAQLAGEISQAGFSRVFCDDFVFPAFRDSDVELLGSYVRNSERRSGALLEVMSAVANAAPASVYTFSYADADAEELSVSELPDGVCVCVRMHPASAADAVTMLQASQELAAGKPLIPWVMSSGMSLDAFNAVLDALYDAGCREIVVSAE